METYSRIDLTEFQSRVDQLRNAITEVVVGQERAVDLILTAILANGHVLVEGVPGVAKTLLTRLISKLIDASFPDYKKLIPKDNEIKLTLNKEELIRDTKLAALFARRSASGSIVLEAKKPNTFSIRSVVNELGENDSIIESEIKEEGKINLNSRFLLDALNVLEEKDINIEFANHINPIIITNKKSSDYTHIIMPLNS